MIEAPGMLMVGGSHRAVGKTAFACAVIERFGSQHDIVAVKVTTIDSLDRGLHPPTADSAPKCDESHSGARLSPATYRIIEEVDLHSGKDTSRMLGSGAKRALWLQAAEPHLEEGITSLCDRLGPEVVSVWESSRVRRHVEPGAFIAIEDAGVGDRKPWAEVLVPEADRVVFYDGVRFDIDWDDVHLLGRRWVVRMEATAILLAGGGSTRMGADKTLLPVGGRPMIGHIHDQLRPWFACIVVSSNNAAAHSFLGAKIVPDEVPGKGPLMGIVSALKAARDDLFFVISADIPEVDIDLVRAMIRQADGCDAIVPHSGRPEPLFAVYRKSVLPVFEQMLSSGHYRMTEALSRCRVKYVPVTQGRIRNINTMSEYHRYTGRTDDVGF